jgi:uncharacterized membrane protein YfcA
MNFEIYQWVFLGLGAAIIGMSKAGIKGIDMLNVTIMALVFGGKTSTGVVLPLLCVADVFAVWYYKRHIKMEYFWKLLPSVIVGILLGVWLGQIIDDRLFKKIMTVIVLLTIIILLWMEVNKKAQFPHNRIFSNGMGLISGFTTMIGNLAGAFSNIYFLATGLPKNEFIGTAAWLFLVINLFKLPFQIFVWKNINFQTFTVDLYLIPCLVIGFFIGKKIVGVINESLFRKLVMGLTLGGSVLLLIS